jgi:hypothetical protein
LKSYRATNGNLPIGRHVHGTRGPGLPDRFYSNTRDVFRSNWPNPEPEQEKPEIILVLAFAASAPVLNPEHEWLALDHQCGGFVCAHRRMIATRLVPRASILQALRSIAREGFDAENGFFGPTNLFASRIASHVQSLTRIGVDCECTWPYLSESIYPIDATQANLNRVAEDELDLQSIAKWPYPEARYHSDPAIIFITQNSD